MRNLKRFLRIFFLSCVVAAALAVFCGAPEEDPRLAVFDNGSIRESEYIEHFLGSTRFKPEKMPDEEDLKKIVTRKALEKMGVMEALDRGIDKDSLYILSFEKNKRSTLFFKYMRREIIDKVINDSLMQAFYANFTPQYKMRYIIRPVVKSSTPEFAGAQKDTIELVYRLLQAGEDFADMANKYSQDITTNKKGGDLGFVIRESLGDAALRAVMDTLTSFTYSRPFRGYEGYYILYKGEKRDVPVPPFEELRGRIWKTLYRTRRHVIQKALDKRFAELAQKYHYKVNEDIFLQVKLKAGGKKSTPETIVLDFEQLTPEDLNTVIAEYDGGVIKLWEIFDDKNRAPDTMFDFRERFQDIADQHLLAKHALELGYGDLPEIKEKLKDVRESLLRSFLFKKNVIDRAAQMIKVMSEKAGNDEEKKLTKSALEKDLKIQLEQEMKDKYRFQFVEKNFKHALKQARAKKIIQNAEQAKKKKQKAAQ